MSSRNSTLWKIESETSQASFLFGSMHIADERVYAKVARIEDLMDQVQCFYTEIDLSKASGIDQSLFQLPQGQNLKSIVGQKKYQKMADIFQKCFQFDLERYIFSFPLMTANHIAEGILGQQKVLPLDSFLWRKANEKSLELKGLELLESQISVLRNIDIEYQVKQLISIKRNPSKFRKKTLALINYYQKEDIRSIYQTTKASLGKYKSLMLFNRNKKMAESIIQNKTIPSIYVVGAAHLDGNLGIISLLKKNKLKLRPIV